MTPREKIETLRRLQRHTSRTPLRLDDDGLVVRDRENAAVFSISDAQLVYGEIARRDAALIVAAVNALPALLDVAEAAEAYQREFHRVDKEVENLLFWDPKITDELERLQARLDQALARLGEGE